MRRALVAVAAFATVLPSPARAAGTHTLEATCVAPWLLVQPVITGYAVSSGTYRSVSTEVTCFIDHDDCCPPPSWHQAVPGPVAVLASATDETAGLEEPDVCVEARGFWADGFAYTTTRVCAKDTVSVAETR